MIEDARISVGFPTHWKTVKLIRRCGEAGAWNMVCLILWVAQHRPKGDLTGMQDEDIEIQAQWKGKPDKFVEVLRELNLLDGKPGKSSMHDWEDWNPWAFGFDERSEKATRAALKKHNKNPEEIEEIIERKRKRDLRLADDRIAPSNKPHSGEHNSAERLADIRTAPSNEPLCPVSFSVSSSLSEAVSDAFSGPQSEVKSTSPDVEKSGAEEKPPTKRRKPPKAAPKTVLVNGEERAEGTIAWEAYSGAYTERHGIVPDRNAATNSMISNLIKSHGFGKTVAICEYYPKHPDAMYVRGRHPMSLLVRDSQRILADMQAIVPMTATRANGHDKTASNPFLPLLAEARERERLEQLNREHPPA